MSDTLLKLELDRLRKLAPNLGYGETLDDLEAELSEKEAELWELEDEIDDLRKQIRVMKGNGGPDVHEQLEIVVTLHRQYRVPLPEDIEAAYEKARANGQAQEVQVPA